MGASLSTSARRLPDSRRAAVAVAVAETSSEMTASICTPRRRKRRRTRSVAQAATFTTDASSTHAIARKLVGERVQRQWSPGVWVDCQVLAFEQGFGKHLVRYVDGISEWVTLDTFRVLMEATTDDE